MAGALAIGVDGAEASVVEQLMNAGELPNLRDLAAAGSWRELRAHGDVGVAAVWPTFVTGTAPDDHGVYADMLWDPDAMELRRWAPNEPVWSKLDNGMRVGALDVPTVRPTGRLAAFEICEWGSHVPVLTETAISPEPAAAIVAAHEPHPFGERPALLPGPDDVKGIARLAAECASGLRRRGRLARSLIAERRPDLALIVFSEVHEAGHAYWHTYEPDSPLYADLPPQDIPPEATIDALLRELDAEVGRLVEAMPSGAAVAVFALHGMGPGRGRPTFLSPLLVERGWAAPPTRAPRNSGALTRAGLGALRRRAPHFVRRAYHSVMPRSTVWRVATRTMLAPHDWSRTRAFALPCDDQHGWVRINLRGRERRGSVPQADYSSVRRELAAELAELKDEEGRSLVTDVLPLGGDDAPPPLLPDLVVHWAPAALARPVRVAGTSVEAMPASMEFTGSHAAHINGFCISTGLPEGSGPVRAEDLARTLVSAAAG